MLKIINNIKQSVEGVLILSVSSTCVMLSVTAAGLVVVPVTTGLCAVPFIMSKLVEEYLPEVLAGETLNNFCKLHSK